MDFITYVLFDFIGTIQGLDTGAYIAKSLKEGTLLTPIILFFAFLSVVRISYFLIKEKNYQKAGIDVFLLLVFIAFFAVTGNFRVWNVNITKGFYNPSFVDKVMVRVNIGTTTSDIGVLPDVDNKYVTVTDVPFMYSMLSFVDMLAHATGEAILNKEAIRENLIKRHLKLYPQDAVAFALIQYTSKADSVEKMSDMIKMAGYCFKVEELAKSIIEKGNLNKDDKALYQQIINELENIPATVAISSSFKVVTCQDVRNGMAYELRKIADNVFGSGSETDEAFKTFLDEMANGIEQDGWTPVVIQKGLLKGLLMQKNVLTNLYNYYGASRANDSIIGQVTEKAKSEIEYKASNVFQSRTFYEWFMYKMQSIAIFIVLSLFPLIVAYAFLPAFGYNFKLLFTYGFGYFLIKLWLPVYFIAYQFLTGQLFNIVNTAVAFLMPTSAHAGVVEVYTALATSIPESQKYANIILNSLAMAIPTALGGGALFLIGKEFYFASKTAVAESLLTAKMLGFMASRGLSALGSKMGTMGGGTGSVSSGSGGTVMSPTLNPKHTIYGSGGGISKGTAENVAGNVKPDYSGVDIGKMKFLTHNTNIDKGDSVKFGIF